MQENLQQVKRSKTLSIFVICLFLVLFTASVFLAVIAPVFTSNGVASAIESTLPVNGRVGDNILINSSNFSESPWIGHGSSLVSGNQFIVNSDWGNISYPLGSSYNDKIVTCTIRARRVSGSGSVALNLRYVSPGSSSTTGLSTVSTVSSEFVILTVSYDLSLYDSSDYYFVIYGTKAGTTFELDWAKFELGSSFTGYVPNYQNQIENLQNEVDSQKDTVANYKFSQRFLTTIDMPSRRLFINMSRLPKFSSKGFIWTSLQGYAALNYFAFTTESSDNVWVTGPMNEVSTLGWKLNYRGNNFTTAELCIGDKVIFSYDVTGTLTGRGPTGSYPTDTDIDNAVVSNPKWYIASNMEYAGIKIYKYDFSGDLSYWYLYTKRSYGGDAVVENVLLDEMYSGSSWCYSFALNDTKDWVDLKTDVYYDLGYKSGVDNGYAGGYSDGQNKGYNEGFSAGKQNGYDIGYSEGVASGQDYSFSALFGAVFDVPIQAFKGLFNFEIFGVNMTSFVSSLLALCVIVVIVKICLGGK